VELCTQGGERDRITEVNEQGALLLLLHDLGVVVAHGLTRNAPAALREVTLLDPNWLTGAVYALLNEPDVIRQGGEFTREQLATWLDPVRYPPERHEYILDMMQNQDLGLCFRLPAAKDEERYLVPEALPPSELDCGPVPDDALRFRYEYDYLPPGMIPRFIVEAHRNLTDKPTRWRTGVVLGVENCRVLVKGDRDRRRVDIAVMGPANRRRSALAVVRERLRVVHDLNPEAGPKARVPLPDDPDNSVGYDHLIELEARKGRHHRFDPEGADRDYSVEELLEGVRGEGRPPQPRSQPLDGQDGEAAGHGRAWTPPEAIRFGMFLLSSFVVLVALFLVADRVAGAAAAAGITALALGAVACVAALMLRSSDRLTEGALMTVIDKVVPRK